MRNLFFVALFITIYSCDQKIKKTEQKHPNIIIIYLDDLGYGDLGCYGANDILTPNIDKLAAMGVRFTNAYATSATCTPSRYALLTGMYPWRKNAQILPGTAPLIIDTAQVTLPKILKNQGYQTAVIGKWHLGLGNGNVDWNQQITPGPNEVGFDHSYIMAATQDRVPTVYIENGLVAGLDPNDPILVNYDQNFEGQPTGMDNPELLKMMWHHGHNSSVINGIPRIGFMKGGESAKWKDEDMADNFSTRVQDYIKGRDKQPFFLYYGMQQPHVPRTPHPRFVGATALGPRGDVIVEADWCVGELMKTLESEGLMENTLIILSSDNGPVLNDGYNDDAVEKLGNHDPKGGLRGGKYSLFEAGTRVPFITYWKGKIQPGVSDALVSQLDILASIGAIFDQKIASADSQDMLNTLLGKSEKGRTDVIIEATTRTALRMGDWIMIPPYGGPKINELVNIELGNDDEYQLYNLKTDPAQQSNLVAQEKEQLDRMIERFLAIRGDDFNSIDQLELK